METGLGPDWHIPVTASGVPQPYDGAEVAAKTMMMPLALPFIVRGFYVFRHQRGAHRKEPHYAKNKSIAYGAEMGKAAAPNETYQNRTSAFLSLSD